MSTLRRIVVLLAIALTLLGCRGRYATITIPDGFVGWVTVSYDSSTCDNETPRVGIAVVSISPEGFGCSSVWSPERLTAVRFFYVDANDARVEELYAKGWGDGGQIWAESSSPSRREYRFFVGSEQAYVSTYTLVDPKNTPSEPTTE